MRALLKLVQQYVAPTYKIGYIDGMTLCLGEFRMQGGSPLGVLRGLYRIHSQDPPELFLNLNVNSPLNTEKTKKFRKFIKIWGIFNLNHFPLGDFKAFFKNTTIILGFLQLQAISNQSIEIIKTNLSKFREFIVLCSTSHPCGKLSGSTSSVY